MNTAAKLSTPALPSLSAFDAVIIDLDGTMVDTLGDFVAALGGMLDALGAPRVSADVVSQIVGKGSEHLIRSVLAHQGMSVDDALFQRAWTLYQQHYLAINGQHSRVYEGVKEGLQAMRECGLRLACLTNKPRDFAKPLLAAKGLDGFFDHVFGGDDFPRKKPDPLPLLKTCEALGTAPARTLMLGDSSNDARAARAAGCPVVLVSYGYNHGEPVQGVDTDGVVQAFTVLAQG